MSKSVLSTDDGVPTRTSKDQKTVEREINYIYEREKNESLALAREKHVPFLLKAFDGLSQGYESLDASKPWLCYWIVHGLDLLDAFPSNYQKRIVEYLSKCQDASGGFCGGPGQLPHIAPTYAAINALIICGSQDEEAYKVINREKLYSFLLRMKSSDGGFTMHQDGEVDVRGTYCALSVARMLNIMTPELTAGAAEYVVRCQTYEGGIGGYPGNEAHGGYTFCGAAAMALMGKMNMLNIPLLLNWVAQRQMDKEGGFQGRTNKLVDSCYSFWQGALFPLIQTYQNSSIDETDLQDNGTPSEWLFNEEGLLKYVLVACQDNAGGLKDKPGKGRDYYHTCYALSGLSLAHSTVIDPQMLKTTHPVHNIRPDRVAKVVEYFKSSTLP